MVYNLNIFILSAQRSIFYQRQRSIFCQRYSATIISVQRYKIFLKYANSCRITPHIFSNCLFSFAFLLFPSLTCLFFFSSSRFLSFYPYLRSFRLSSFFSLISVHFAYLRSFRPNCIRASALLSRHISTKLGRSPVSPVLISFRPNDIRLHHRSKLHFFSPYCKKNRNSLANVRFFSYLCTAIGQMAVFC